MILTLECHELTPLPVTRITCAVHRTVRGQAICSTQRQIFINFEASLYLMKPH